MNPLADQRFGSPVARAPQPPDMSTFEVEAVGAGQLPVPLPVPPARPSGMQRAGIPRRETAGGGINPLARAPPAAAPRVADTPTLGVAGLRRGPAKPEPAGLRTRDPGTAELGRQGFLVTAGIVLSLLLSVSTIIVVRHIRPFLRSTFSN